jgi:hypothetical protein
MSFLWRLNIVNDFLWDFIFQSESSIVNPSTTNSDHTQLHISEYQVVCKAFMTLSTLRYDYGFLTQRGGKYIPRYATKTFFNKHPCRIQIYIFSLPTGRRDRSIPNLVIYENYLMPYEQLFTWPRPFYFYQFKSHIKSIKKSIAM